MGNSVASYLARWNMIRIFSFVWLCLTIGLITLSFPAWSIYFAALAGVMGILLGSWSIFKGLWNWARNSVLIADAMFLVSLFAQIQLTTLPQSLPASLLEFVMVLYSVELFSLICKHHKIYSRDTFRMDTESAVLMLSKSMQQLVEGLGRLGLVFASCYVVAISVLYAGAVIAPIAPVLSDISLYIVAVSISLAILLILREDQPSDEITTWG